ncbi:substrate-binding domain-containing protein [Enhydrobacter sp.]|jgi:molybdate transport system substrate-binding protein|uniref:molybdate ABC transporter substrate-binding protein n=1 Tax=Enhydrobacter sp. TaxID=1894999 RepID=UPI0026113261|nr:substrate-binding domain-containing protein [Enhydrobacter sp.]WIM11595.1 MAG: putative ABC transport system, periplasmic component [Enhydrobacter sp.]
MTRTLRLLSGGAAQGLVEAVRPAFEAETGCRLEGVFGAVGAMRDRLAAGERVDLLILSRALIEGLAREGQIEGASARDLGTVATAIAVRAGDCVPPLVDAEALRRVLLAADAIHFPDPARATAGIHFAKVMAKLGLEDRLVDRLRPAPNGATAMRALAASRARRPIGCTQATEILATPGIVLAAPLPPGCDLSTVYTAAIATNAEAPREAAILIERLTAPTTLPTRQRLGFA